jgi:glyoxylase-like metal-dependent hydrolase (beta-lactamase superfamily II)
VILERVTHPRWLSNTWLVADREGGTGAIVDAGGPVAPLLEQVRARRVRVAWLLSTHHHPDHTAENSLLKSETGARLGAHTLETALVPGVDAAFTDGQLLTAGELSIRVLHIPGHTAGQAAYLVNDAICFTGDTLFRGSVGSTTAPGHTTFADLRRSLVDRLLALPDAVRVAPGHAEPTTVGEERATNPFLRVLLGEAPEGEERAAYGGQEVRLIVWARDYDGGHKAWIRLDDGTDLTVPGSRVTRGGSPPDGS